MADAARYTAELLDRKERSLSQRAYDRILDMLIKREIPVGTVLQERRLAEILQISRTPAREALYRLETEGFITRKPGRVLIVKEFSARELIEILHVRKILESEGASLATGRIPTSELDAIETGILELMGKPSPTAAEDWEVDEQFHRMIAQYSGNTALAKMIQDLRLKTHMFNLDRVPERFEAGHREHLEVIASLRENNRDRARAAIEQHIENVKRSIIQKLSQM
jgi:DNA-binding GntR family transcriptional regulator